MVMEMYLKFSELQYSPNPCDETDSFYISEKDIAFLLGVVELQQGDIDEVFKNIKDMGYHLVHREGTIYVSRFPHGWRSFTCFPRILQERIDGLKKVNRSIYFSSMYGASKATLAKILTETPDYDKFKLRIPTITEALKGFYQYKQHKESQEFTKSFMRFNAYCRETSDIPEATKLNLKELRGESRRVS